MRYVSFSLLFACVVAALWPAAAQDRSGPNFSPNSSVGWIAIGQEFFPPSSGPGPVTMDPAHMPKPGQSAFRVADLANPILQPWAREELRKANERALSGKPAYTPKERCWPIGVPGFLLYPVFPVYFLQAPKEVVMIWQADHQVRHVYLNAEHSKNPKPSWYGESVGHYEGDTLVVDTIGISEKTLVDNFATPHTAELHTTERYRMSDDRMQLEVKLHVEDPGAFTTPWDAIQRYRRVEPGVAEPRKASGDLLSATGNAGPMLESSCAENPHGLFDAPGTLPIPQADTPNF